MTFDAGSAVWFGLEISVRTLAAAAAVGLVLRLLRVRAAALLHAAWSAVLVAMLFMPVLPSIVPALPLPLPATAGTVLGSPSSIDQPSPGSAVDLAPAAVSVDRASSRAMDSSESSREPRHRSILASRESRAWLPVVVLGIYATGVFLFVARLVHGWFLASAMIRRATRSGPIRVNSGAIVYQSSDVTVPMTVGALRPVIVLPAAWTTWDADVLAAIVAHETAHVHRRDAAISLAAHLNRAIFWFNPLAWWLERTLATTAEHACDEAAARAIASPRRYAEILVDMADLVRRHRGRVAWQAVGVNGAGLLDLRIDRLLGGDGFASTSRATTIAAAIGCVVVLAAAIACRHEIEVAPLREDPELAKRIANSDQQTKQFEAARDMTQEQAAALEQRIAANPEDFAARGQLVTYYRTSKTVAWDTKVPSLRRHALWLIEHHPEREIAPPALSPQYDPEGFAAAKKLWEAQLARPDASAYLVYRAAMFFAPHDKPYAEQLIMRGTAMDPQSAALKARMAPDVGGYEWPVQLSFLYAAALRGSESAWGTYNDLRTHLDQVNSPYAIEVRKKLDATTDAKLLARVGSILRQSDGQTKDPALKQAMDDARARGIRYLERALELDPTDVIARAIQVRTRLPERATDADRLANQAHERYMVSEDITDYAKKDAAAAKQQRDEAKARAEEALKIAAAHAQDPAYSAATMTAHHVLALAALRDGDRERAVQHLRESVNVPPSEQIQYALPFSWNRPVNRLLKEGERERVAEFLEAMARVTIVERDRLMKDAQSIRDGRMPASYQRMVAREGH